jgi:hypothetical protein
MLVLTVFCAACGDEPPNVNDANTTVNVNTSTNNTTNGNGTNDTNTRPTPVPSVVPTNGNKGNPNNRNTSRIRNLNAENVNQANANSSPQTPTSEKNDKITVDYPMRLLEDDNEDNGKVIFYLQSVNEVVTPTTTINGNKGERVDKPGQISGAAPGTLRPKDDADKYDVYVEVNLLTNGLIKNSPTNLKRLYKGRENEKWEWVLKTAPGVHQGDQVSFRFQVNVTWKAKTQDVSTREISDVWQNNFDVKVGPPARRVNAALYGSPLFAAGGLVTIGTSRRRRKELTDKEIEEDGIEDQPEQAEAKPAPSAQSKMAAPEEEVEDEVNGTVYAPGQAAQGNSFLVQVFIHLPEQADALDEIAKEADEDAKRRISSKLQKKIKRGTELTFHLQMPGLSVDDDVQSCVWDGEPVWVQFGVTVPEDCKPKNIIGTVTVSESSIPVGHLRFKFKITGAQSSEVEAEAPGLEPAPAGNLTRYQQAFISYASKDRQEVLKRVQMLNVAKIKFFQDLLTLEPGDQWEKLLYEYIDKSDVFFLFWSKAASESEWVKKEVEYAIKRRADKDLPDPEIIPVIIEGPPAARPPVELSSIHFNDKLIYFINTREVDAQPGQG